MSTSSPINPQLEQLKGNCHCGRFRFQLSANLPLRNLLTCACTLCTKLGCLWLRATTGGFIVTRDEQSLVEYQGFQFCGKCGTTVTGEHQSGLLKGEVLINARALWGFDPFQHDLGSIDKVPVATDDLKTASPRLSADDTSTATHVGSCHCGKVRVELLVDIGTLEVKEDNCSSCTRNAYIGIYPTNDQVRIHGSDNTFEYLYGNRFNGAAHCKTCGVLVFNNVYGPPISVFDRLPQERKEQALAVYWKNMAMRPLNVRALDFLDVGSLNIQRTDEGTVGYLLET